MKRFVVILFLSFFAAGYVQSEQYPRWEGFPPMYTINSIVEFKDYVYCITKGGMFRYNPETEEYKFYYKNQGLVSNDVLCIGATTKEIFIGFKEDGLWRFDPDTEKFQNILFPEYHVKTTSHPNGIAVRNIFARSDSVLYIGHANGLDMINLYTEELRSYTSLGSGISENTAVTEVKVFNGKIWVCTPQGLAVADEDNPNLEFAENWKSYTYTVRDVNYSITSVLHVTDPSEAVYLGTPIDGIFILDEKSDQIQPTASPRTDIFMLSEGFGTYWATSDAGLYTKQVNLWKTHDSKYTGLTAIFPGADNKLWIGTKLNGLQCYTPDGYIDIPSPDELKSMTFYDIEIGNDNVIWTATTYRDSDMNSVFQRLQDKEWTAYYKTDWSLTNRVVSTLVDTHGQIWTALWGSNFSGVYVIIDDGTPLKGSDSIFPADESNVIFKPTIISSYVVCSDIAEDKHGNIWVANYQEDPPNHKIEGEPTSGAVVVDGYPITRYQHYSPAEDGLPTAVIAKLCTDDDGWVWIGTYNSGIIGLFVGEDPFDKSDTEIHALKLEHGMLSLRINALARDRDGYIWVGSEAGLNRITKQSGHTLLVEDMNESLGGADREIHTIEVDKYNNKWIGTSGGLLKLNAKNEAETLYTTTNSGLFSDSILSLKYDNQADILWVGTGSGLNKFHVFEDEIAGESKGIHVYPNPFEIWGYDSRAVFPFLKSGSMVRIYSFTGNLVNELSSVEDSQSKGSTAIWDGKNYEGRYVGSGVYFFTGEDINGRLYRDKMVVIRR